MAKEEIVNDMLAVYATKQSVGFLNWFINSDWKWYNTNTFLNMETNEFRSGEEMYEVYQKIEQQ